ncbi:ABC transporter substrate-binding protein [Microbacterium indicum]|uniref:ABC transporter substrate-binding protein n=1 Tax=Microbacterium indicum TaxID=358100 RepID=UPI000413E410|nr:ABC transporter substrate-binding protein [Microbacterium indicum]
MTLRRTLTAGAVFAASALVLASCSGGSGGPASGDVDPDATLNVGLVTAPTNLDIRSTSGVALEQALVGNVYEGLVARDDGEDVVPALASSWDVSDDGLTYTFDLETGVTFHDGADMTAGDVVWSLDQVRGDAGAIGSSDLASVASVDAPDDQTVVITLAEPDQDLLFALTGPAGIVLDEGDDTDMRTAENGTGPFTLGEWNQGDSIVLERYDGYWGDAAGVAEVVLSYFDDTAAMVNAGLDGSLDVLAAVDNELAPQLEDGFDVTTADTTDKFILAFNSGAAPLDDPRVREALRLAIDHDAIVAAVGTATAQYGPIPELDPGYEDLSDTLSFDPDEARSLLAEAGAQDLTLTLTMPNHYSTTVSNLVVSMLADVGVTLRIDRVEFSTWLNDVFSPDTRGDWQLSYVDHVEARDFATWTDPDYYYAMNDEDALAQVQDLYAQAMRQTDADASADLLAQAARVVAEQNPVDWLYTWKVMIATAPYVHGFPTWSPSSRLPFAGVTVDAA